MAKEVICDALGRTCEPYTDEWGDVPLTIWKDKAAQTDISGLMGQLAKQIEKAQGTVYVYIPDGGTAAKKSITVGSGSLTATAKYKGTLGNTVKIVSVANPVDGFDVSIVINGSEVELFEGIKTMDELKGVSEYVDFSGTGAMEAFASATLEGGTDVVAGSGNAGISDFLDKLEKVRFNCACFPSTESSLQTALLTKIKYIRESIGWKCQAVAPNFAADYEGIINLVNSFVYGDRELTTAEACAAYFR